MANLITADVEPGTLMCSDSTPCARCLWEEQIDEAPVYDGVDVDEWPEDLWDDR